MNRRLAGFGTTIFAEISALARAHGAVDLGQGAPDGVGPEFVKRAAIEAIEAGHDQYAPPAGTGELVSAVADRWHGFTGTEVEPAAWVTVTNGATEALAATLLGVLNPGDEVILFEPFYDAYRAVLALAQAEPRYVRLRGDGLRFDPEELRAAFGPRTRAVLVNTPHNPTGKVFSRAELEEIAGLCREREAIAITDEVYEHLVYDDREHVRMATLPGMAERTVTLSSMAKTFSLTGWKVGWAVAPPDLTAAVRAAHQFLTFCVAHPLQHGAAAALRAPASYYESLCAGYSARRSLLLAGVRAAGFGAIEPEGAFFVVADAGPLGFADDRACCDHLIREVGVAAIPVSAFCEGPPERSLVRFSFCKSEETIRRACERLARMG